MGGLRRTKPERAVWLSRDCEDSVEVWHEKPTWKHGWDKGGFICSIASELAALMGVGLLVKQDRPVRVRLRVEVVDG